MQFEVDPKAFIDHYCSKAAAPEDCLYKMSIKTSISLTHSSVLEQLAIKSVIITGVQKTDRLAMTLIDTLLPQRTH